jgi:hypothetical protein
VDLAKSLEGGYIGGHIFRSIIFIHPSRTLPRKLPACSQRIMGRNARADATNAFYGRLFFLSKCYRFPFNRFSE